MGKRREKQQSEKIMASLDSPNPSFSIRETTTRSATAASRFLRSISTKEPSFSTLPYSPPRFSSPISLHTSPLSSPHHPFNAAAEAASSSPEATSSYRCISSVLKKDGQILCIVAANGFIYTGSDSNLIRVWKLPDFTECGRLKAKKSTVVAMEVSHDRVYAAYGDGKIRVWRRTWDNGLKHVKLATIPKTGRAVRRFIVGKDKMVM